MSKKSALSNSVDEHVGRRIALTRQMQGYTQKDLAEKCGVTFQQIQKYENGDNRIPASRLFAISTALEKSVTFFFLGLPGNYPEETKATRSMRVSDLMSIDDPLGKNESLELVKAFWLLPDDKSRLAVWNLIKQLSVSE